MPSDDFIDAILRDAGKRAMGQYEPFRAPVKLHPKQQQFYDDDRFEIAYGGAASGGKNHGPSDSHGFGISLGSLARCWTSLMSPAG